MGSARELLADVSGLTGEPRHRASVDLAKLMKWELLVNPDDPMPMSFEEVLERIGRELGRAQQTVARERPTPRSGRAAHVAEDLRY
jgi:hypothetical protein